MRINPLNRTLKGERILGIQPPLDPHLQLTWRRRLRLFTGRSLSDIGLTIEQDARAGHLAIRGQAMAPGVVGGLEVVLEWERVGETSTPYLRIGAGAGIAATGEDVIVPWPVRLAVGDLPVCAPPGVLLPGVAAGGGDLEPDGELGAIGGPGDVFGPVSGGPIDLPGPGDASGPGAGPGDAGTAGAGPGDASGPGAGAGETIEGDLSPEPVSGGEVAGGSRAVMLGRPTSAGPVLAGSGAGELAVGGPTVAPAAGGPGAMEVRRVGPTLSELWDNLGGRPLPDALMAGFLLAQPVTVETREEPRVDVCDDPSDYAFEDWQRIDGCRFVFYAWPTEWLSLPAPGAQWRNRLAYAVFGMEEDLGLAVPPWAELGVPLAMIGFDGSGSPVFADRFSVVRAGGQPPLMPRPLETGGTPVLWQARMQQFAEHLGDAGQEAEPIEEIAQEFRYLPPAGLLPKEALDIAARRSEFFTPGFNLTAAPVPTEQLDVALGPSAGTQPFDLFTPDVAEVLVPVPQVFYEPRLLQTEQVDAEFQQAIDSFTTRRGRWLFRRIDVREKAGAVGWTIRASAPVFPSPDPGQLEEEDLFDPIDPADPLLALPDAGYGTEDVDGVRTVAPLEQLRGDLQAKTPIKYQTIESLAALPAGLSFGDPSSKIIFSNQKLIFEGQMSVQERTSLLAASPDAAYQAAVNRLYTRSQDDELSKLDVLGVEGFIKLLEEKIQKSDDTVDIGFLHTQASMYRVRQVLLGSDAASRLATSPALATIAQGQTALATNEDIKGFFDKAKTATRANGLEPEAAAEGLGDVAPGSDVASTAESQDKGILGGATTVSEIGGMQFLGGGQTLGIVGGIGTTVAPTILQQIAAQPITAISIETAAGRQPLFKGIIEQAGIAAESPLPGTFFRTATIAQRLATPPANDGQIYALSSKVMVMSSAVNLPIDVDDLSIPGFLANGQEVLTNIGTIKADKAALFGAILNGDHDPVDPARDEAAYLSTSVRSLDHSIGILRVIEGRVQAYKRALEMCRTTLAELQGLANQARQRLGVIEDNLAEARHDVAVARALLAEEVARIEAINSRRTQVLAEHVTFLAYRRPRTARTLLDSPVRQIDPGLTEQPVPACLANQEDPPLELRSMIDLIRQSPIKWFAHVPAVLDKLRQPDDLKRTLAGAKLRAQAATAAPAARALVNAGNYAKPLTRVITAQSNVVTQYHLARTTFDLSRVANMSWVGIKAEATQVLTLGDLIDGDHGRSDVAQRAASELHDITGVSSCLYHQFGEVRPAIRLIWAERFSQFDDAVSLRNLSSLPRWGEVEFFERRETQMLVDWLYQRVDSKLPEAVGLIDTLVRVAVLLASHAPVNQIIAGKLQKPTVARPGDRINVSVLTAQLSKVTIGMQAHVYSGSNVVATAVVQDMLGGQVSAQVVATSAPSVNLSEGSIVHLSMPSFNSGMQGSGTGAQGSSGP
jgi:hypothetical protein